MIFFKKTVDSILAGITKQVEALQAVRDQEAANAESATDLASSYLVKAQGHKKEAARADRVYGRLKELIS